MVLLLIHRDENGNTHWASIKLDNDDVLQLYPAPDLAIIKLPETFYATNSEGYFLHPDHHVDISVENRGLGHDVAILGYPLQELKFNEVGDIDFSGICLRADKGVVNQRVGWRYEFTIPFNPGNSGGPVFDVATGRVFAMVRASRDYYKQTPDGQILLAKYSLATSTRAISELLKTNQII